MTIFWSARRADWRRSISGVDWLGTYGTHVPAAYPPALDAMESALARRTAPLQEAAAAALAPRWEELGRSRESADPRETDTPDVEEDDAEERLLLYAAAHAISQLGTGYGCAFAIGPGTERSLLYFAVQLARLGERTGFELALSGPISALPGELVRQGITRSPRCAVPSAAAPLSGLAPADCRVVKVLAVSQAGAPLTAAMSLGLSQQAADDLTTPGPDGSSWIALSTGARRGLRAGLDMADRRRHAIELFDAWPPQGWGYLRRSHLAIASGDYSRLRRQHAALFAGCAVIGRELLQRHAVAMAAAVPAGRNAPEAIRTHQISAHFTASRLAARLQPVERARREAVFHLRRARRLAANEVEHRVFTHELANALAKQRTSSSLAKSRELYEGALRDAAVVEDAVQRARLEIILLNGLALVEYFEGDNQAALDLEERAEQLAFYLADRQEVDLARWAFGLVNPNCAKLLLVRFHDRQRAIAKLATALEMTRSDPRLSNKIRRDLARLVFAEKNYPEVVRLLGSVFTSSWPTDLKPSEEFHDRMLLAMSQLEQNGIEGCREQLAPLRILAHRMGSDTATSALSVLTQAVGAA